MAEADAAPWAPPEGTFSFVATNRRAVRRTRLASHPGFPFADVLRGLQSPPTEVELGKVALEYLLALREALKQRGQALDLPNGWLCALEKPGSALLRWLPVWPAFGAEPGPPPVPQLASWRLARRSDVTGLGLGSAVTLVAAEVLQIDGVETVIARQFGLRIPMRVVPDRGGLWHVAIRGMSAELPRRPLLSMTEARLGTAAITPQDYDIFSARITATNDHIARRLNLAPGLSYDTFLLREGKPDGRPVLELRGRGVDADGTLPVSNRVPYAFSVRYGLEASETAGEGAVPLPVLGADKAPLVTHAAEPQAFRRSPAAAPDPTGAGYDWSGRRPTRPDSVLDIFRTAPHAMPNAKSFDLKGHGFEVRRCPGFVQADVAPGHRWDDPESQGVKTFTQPDDGWLPSRRDDFTAYSAWNFCEGFYGFLRFLGIPLSTFTVAVDPTLKVYYRAGIVPGPGGDGRTINAQVVIAPTEPPDGDPAILDGPKPVAMMRLALAELTRWARPPDAAGNPGPAQPLGLASDPRWMWHEFGHVLLAARFAELDFDFAHSPGDAMAAIAGDPFSELARPDLMGGTMRGATYPFVFTPRRHDRSVLLGWGWQGALNRPLLLAMADGEHGFKGYVAEQILSSTLFRLYRILGGDTVTATGEPDRVMRVRAAVVTLYLLIEGVRSLAQAPSLPDMLAEAIIETDISLTTPLDLMAAELSLDPSSGDMASKTPRNGPSGQHWAGGARKAVRWAFEAQGLYGPEWDKDAVPPQHDAPGAPPEIDIYIPDRRPDFEMTGSGLVRHGPGSYVPVSLDWEEGALWLGAPDALDLATWTVVLRNRGKNPGTGVTQRAWIGLLNRQAAGWVSAGSITWFGPFALEVDAQVTALKAARSAAEAALTADHRMLALVEATCAGDPANTDPGSFPHVAPLTAISATGLPPTVPRLVADLVANDNNLGLWDITPTPPA